MTSLHVRQERLAAFCAQELEDIDQSRLKAWSAYEEIHSMIGTNKQ